MSLAQHPQALPVRVTMETAAGAALNPATQEAQAAGSPLLLQTGASQSRLTKPSASFYLASAAANNNAQVIAAGARDVHGVYGVNKSAGERTIRLYNKATTPAPASDVPLLTLVVPPGRFDFTFPVGVSFGTGIGLAIVTNATALDNTAVAAGDIVGLMVLAGAFA